MTFRRRMSRFRRKRKRIPRAQLARLPTFARAKLKLKYNANIYWGVLSAAEILTRAKSETGTIEWPTITFPIVELYNNYPLFQPNFYPAASGRVGWFAGGMGAGSWLSTQPGSYNVASYTGLQAASLADHWTGGAGPWKVQPKGWDRCMLFYDEYRVTGSRIVAKFTRLPPETMDTDFGSNTRNIGMFGNPTLAGPVTLTKGSSPMFEAADNIVYAWQGMHPAQGGTNEDTMALDPADRPDYTDLYQPINYLTDMELRRQPGVKQRCIKPWDASREHFAVFKMYRSVPLQMARGIESNVTGQHTIEESWNATDKNWEDGHYSNSSQESWDGITDNWRSMDGWGFFNFAFGTSWDVFGDAVANDKLTKEHWKDPGGLKMDVTQTFYVQFRGAHNPPDNYQLAPATVTPNAVDQF